MKFSVAPFLFCSILLLLSCISSAQEAAVSPDGAALDDLLRDISTYEFGQSRESLSAVARRVGDSLGDTNEKRDLSLRLVEVLRSDATKDCKEFVCRQLARIGSAESVPALAGLLKDKDLGTLARFALESIPHPAAGDALRNALEETSGTVKVGIINSLGERGNHMSAIPLSKCLEDPESEVACAAARALGKIGGVGALNPLLAARERASGQLRQEIGEACLACAEGLLAEGRTRLAIRVCKTLYSPDEPITIRVAALRRLAATENERSAPEIVAALTCDVPQLQAAAKRLIHQTGGEAMTRALASELPRLDVCGKVLLFEALAMRGDRIAEREITWLVQPESGMEQPTEVRIAALRMLASFRGSSLIPWILSVAATATGEEREAARSTLVRLQGKGVDLMLWGHVPLRGMSWERPGVNAEAIRALVARGVEIPVDQLLHRLEDPYEAVRSAALRGLALYAAAEHLPVLLKSIVKAEGDEERQAATEALTALCGRMEDKAPCVDAALNALDGDASAQAKGDLLQVLAGIGGEKALDRVRISLEEADLRNAALAALVSWPDASPVADLLKIAQDDPEKQNRLKALAGYVGLVSLDHQRGFDETVKMYQSAMEAARDIEEKRVVLEGISPVAHPDLLEMVAGVLDDEALRGAAVTTALRVAKSLSGAYREKAVEVLKKVEEAATDEEDKSDARRAIEILGRYGDFITAWFVSGPYGEEGQGKDDLFDAAFPPEVTGEEEVSWKVMPSICNPDRPWLVDLGSLLGEIEAVAYLKTTLVTSEECDAKLELGSNDAVKAWLNGELVHSNNAARQVHPADDVVEISLKKGINALLLKIINAGGGWGACARLRDSSGNDLAGVEVDLRN